jgi:cell division protease FtsH
VGNVFGFGRTQARQYDAERPQITFTDVAGQDAAKAELVEIVDFLREPDKYVALGARIPRGVLLVGPPGTGKTLIARAVAGEAKVAFFSLAASEFVEMFVGVGASRVRDLFKRAKENAPSIIFIDEIDAVGRRRGAGLGGGHDEREQTLNQMLSEMDGFDQSETVIVMAATNRADVLDPALLRPGRFDRQVTMSLPDRNGRADILKIHTRGKPLADDVDLVEMARATIGFSGADLANLANEAALNAARSGRKRINMASFFEAFERIVLGLKSPPLANEHERKVVAYHEAGHALVAALSPDADPVFKVTIVPRGQALGITAQLPDDDRRNYSRSYLEARMLVLLGGRAAEEIALGEITTGASNDLQRVTELARRMVKQFGMSEVIGPLNFGDEETQPFLGYSLSQERHYSEDTAAIIDTEIKRLVEDAYKHALHMLGNNRDKLDMLAQELLTNEVVDRQRVLEIAGVGLSTADEVAVVATDGDITDEQAGD